MTVEIEGLEEFNKAITRFAKDNEKETDRLLADMAFDTQQEAVDLIRKPSKPGKTYKRRGVTHTASAPFNPPNADTGNLMSNIKVVRERMLNYTVGTRGSGAPYGLYLEFGTSKMKARPWLSPAVDKILKQYKSVFDR
jgi:HK97 gp10 family phage protein